MGRKIKAKYLLDTGEFIEWGENVFEQEGTGILEVEEELAQYLTLCCRVEGGVLVIDNEMLDLLRSGAGSEL